MALVLKLKWVEQSDQPEAHLRIRRIGGSSRELQWEHTQAQAIEAIESAQFGYYMEKDGRVFELEIGQTPGGQKYLTVHADGGNQQLLLELPGFPNRESVRSTVR